MTIFLPNRLNEYDTYTYNLKLYMVNPFDLPRLDGAIKTGKARLIADNSSIANYNISDVEQIFVLGHNQVRETFSNNFTVKVSEANGVTLLSTLKLLSLDLGIESHLQAGYIMSVEFRGRTPDGRAKKHDQVFFYPLLIKQLDFQVDSGGALYNIEMIESSSNGYNYMSNVVKEQITIVARTVGEFVDEFEKKINESQRRAWVLDVGALFVDTYEFKFDKTTENWRRWRFQVLDEELTVNGNNFVSAPGGDKALQVTINNGSNISAIFGSVLQLTAEYKRILVHQDTAGEKFLKRTPKDDTEDSTLDSLPVFFKTITNVEYKDFDVLKGAYQKNIIYKIKAFTVTDEVISPTAYVKSITNPEVQKKRVSNLISGNFLRKKFEYYYTGKNTEVLEFDMKFDMAYFYVTALGGGWYGDADVQTPAGYQSPEEVIAIIRDRKKSIADIQRNINSSLNDPQAAEAVDILRTRLDAEQNEFISATKADIQFLREKYELSEADISYQLKFGSDVITDSDTATSDNDNRSGALQFGAVKTNLENASDMIQIEIGIRGDPYWMGMPNSLFNQQRSVEDLADYEAGSPSFFFHANLPTPDEDATGRRKPQPDYQISGIYTVRTVINRFQNGMFTQYLTAVRDVATNTSTIWDKLAGDQSMIEGLDRASVTKNARNIAQEQEDNYRNSLGNS